jgi:three-Cys-motif partner protein
MTKLTKLRAEDDGLLCPEVGSWAEDKYKLVSLYDELFASGVRRKWGSRVYIDLYAGAGYSRVHGTSTVLKGSPMLALTVPHPFDKYIFCEENPALFAALKERTQRIAPSADVTYVLGNCHAQIESICRSIPSNSPGGALSLCFVDPFDFGIKFETLRRLSSFKVDFLVLLAIGMDANRNYDHYVDGESHKIDEALGGTEWRERWKKAGSRRKEFRGFLAEEFARSMSSLGYLEQPLHRMRQVRSDVKNLPLYHLALFSRHELAYKFWDEVLKYSTDQTSLGFED